MYYEPPKSPPQLTRPRPRVSVGRTSHPQLRPSNHKPFINAAHLECYDPLVPVNGRPAVRDIPLTLDKYARAANQPDIAEQLDWYINILEWNFPDLPHLTAKLKQARTYRGTALYRSSNQLPRQEMTKSAKIRRGVHRSLFHTTGSCFPVLPCIQDQHVMDSRFGNYYETWQTPNTIPLSSAPYDRESLSEVRYLSAPTTVDNQDKKPTGEIREISTQSRKADRLYSASSAFSLAPSVYAETELPCSRASSGSPPSRFDLQDYRYPGCLG